MFFSYELLGEASNSITLNNVHKSRNASASLSVESDLCEKYKKHQTPKTQCEKMQIKDKLTIREIQCNEPLIFNILAWSKGFYENEWNVNIGLNLG